MYAFNEMMDNVAPLREFYAPFLDESPGMLGMKDSGRILAHYRKKRRSPKSSQFNKAEGAGGWIIRPGYRSPEIYRAASPK